MRKGKGIFLLAWSLVLGALPVQALDPVSLTGAITAALESFDFMKKLFGFASEASSLLSELEDLGGEMGRDSRMLQELQSWVDQVQEIEGMAQEIGYEQEALKQLREDFYSTENLRSLVSHCTQLIRTWKRQRSKLKEALGQDKIEKVASHQIKGNQLLEQQLQAQLELLKGKEQKKLAQWKEKLSEQKKQKQQIQKWRKELSDQGVKEDPKTKLLSFPSKKSALKKALRASKVLQQRVFLLFGLAFMLRLLAGQLGMGTPTEALHHVVVCGAVLSAYPFLAEHWIEVCFRLGEALGNPASFPLELRPSPVPAGDQGTFLFWKVPSFELLREQLRWGLLKGAQLLFEGGLQLGLMLFPIAVLLAFTFHSMGILKVWALCGGWLACWPLFWGALGRLAHELHSGSAGAWFQSLVYQGIQWVFPLLGFSWLKNPLSVGAGGAKALLRVTHHVPFLRRRIK